MRRRTRELLLKWYERTYPKDRTYQSYVHWCSLLDAPPVSFNAWLSEVMKQPEPWLVKFSNPPLGRLQGRLDILDAISREFASNFSRRCPRIEQREPTANAAQSALPSGSASPASLH